ncbi:MAG: VanZ family protein [Desulfobacca sp.]|uniref:VanZ family protein n=1 Tax=Desulfobacca sp. TaxID=2067990 RepID=UPI00404935DD
MGDPRPQGAGGGGGVFFYPVAWSALLIVSAGDWYAATETLQLIHWLTSWFMTPNPNLLATINLWARKSGHVLAYGVLSYLWFRAIHHYWRCQRRLTALLTLGLCLTVALIDEGRQIWSPSRQASPRDLLLDLIGIGAAAGLAAFLYRPRCPGLRCEASRTRMI